MTTRWLSCVIPGDRTVIFRGPWMPKTFKSFSKERERERERMNERSELNRREEAICKPCILTGGKSHVQYNFLRNIIAVEKVNALPKLFFQGLFIQLIRFNLLLISHQPSRNFTQTHSNELSAEEQLFLRLKCMVITQLKFLIAII